MNNKLMETEAMPERNISMRELRNSIGKGATKTAPVAVDAPKDAKVRPTAKAGLGTGLKRISAVIWWGVAVLACFVAMGMASNALRVDAASGIGYFLGAGGGMWAVIYVLHRITCWVIDGFTTAET